MREFRSRFTKWSAPIALARSMATILGGVSLGLACSHPPPPAPAAAPAARPAPPPCPAAQPLRLSLAASARLNPGEKGEALATVVRLYQLKGASRLMGLSFDDLLDRDKEALGEDFLSVQEVTINPGERLNPATTRNPEAAYILAVALFRRPAGTTWKVTKRLAPADPEYCRPKSEQANAEAVIRLFLDENRLELR